MNTFGAAFEPASFDTGSVLWLTGACVVSCAAVMSPWLSN